MRRSVGLALLVALLAGCNHTAGPDAAVFGSPPITGVFRDQEYEECTLQDLASLSEVLLRVTALSGDAAIDSALGFRRSGHA